MVLFIIPERLGTLLTHISYQYYPYYISNLASGTITVSMIIVHMWISNYNFRFFPQDSMLRLFLELKWWEIPVCWLFCNQTFHTFSLCYRVWRNYKAIGKSKSCVCKHYRETKGCFFVLIWIIKPCCCFLVFVFNNTSFVILVCRISWFAYLAITDVVYFCKDTIQF